MFFGIYLLGVESTGWELAWENGSGQPELSHTDWEKKMSQGLNTRP